MTLDELIAKLTEIRKTMTGKEEVWVSIDHSGDVVSDVIANKDHVEIVA